MAENSTNDNDSAWIRGYIDCSEGVTASPFSYDDKRKKWQEGWNHYDAEYNPSYYTLQNAEKNGWI